jgi:1,4-dihydroxy-2-naphthoate octaprenyltransferase
MHTSQTATIAANEPTPDKLQGVPKYIAATRPPFLIASVLPVLIGIGAAWHTHASFSLFTALLTLLGAILAQSGINVLNDYYDHLNGTDEQNTGRIFPFTGGSRFIQNKLLTPQQTLQFGLGLFGVTIAIGLILTFISGPELIIIGLIGLFIGWAYSAPPIKLNSNGFGELSVAFGFGIIIPLGAAYAQTGTLSMVPVYAAFAYALLVTNLLYINQFPDREADDKAGKHHLVVRLGADIAKWGYLVIATVAYLGLLALVLLEWLPALALLGLIAAPISMAAGLKLIWYAHTPEKLAGAIQLTILSIVIEGITITVAMSMA